MKDNLDEELAYWQEQVEQVNLELIDRQELTKASPHEIGHLLRQEMQRRASDV